MTVRNVFSILFFMRPVRFCAGLFFVPFAAVPSSYIRSGFPFPYIAVHRPPLMYRLLSVPRQASSLNLYPGKFASEC